jgi:hypothetical protein
VGAFSDSCELAGRQWLLESVNVKTTLAGTCEIILTIEPVWVDPSLSQNTHPAVLKYILTLFLSFLAILGKHVFHTYLSVANVLSFFDCADIICPIVAQC